MDPSIEELLVGTASVGALPVWPAWMCFVVLAGYCESAKMITVSAPSWLCRHVVGLLVGVLACFWTGECEHLLLCGEGMRAGGWLGVFVVPASMLLGVGAGTGVRAEAT